MNVNVPADYNPWMPLSLGSAAREMCHALSELAERGGPIMRETREAGESMPARSSLSGERRDLRDVLANLRRDAESLRASNVSPDFRTRH